MGHVCLCPQNQNFPSRGSLLVGTSRCLQVGHGRGLLARTPPVARPVHQCLAHTLDNLKVSDKKNPFGELGGHARLSLHYAPLALRSFCPYQCSYPVKRATHASSCPFGSTTVHDLSQTSVLPRRGSTSRDLEPGPGSGEAPEIFMSRGFFCQFLMKSFLKVLCPDIFCQILLGEPQKYFL